MFHLYYLSFKVYTVFMFFSHLEFTSSENIMFDQNMLSTAFAIMAFFWPFRYLWREKKIATKLMLLFFALKHTLLQKVTFAVFLYGNYIFVVISESKGYISICVWLGWFRGRDVCPSGCGCRCIQFMGAPPTEPRNSDLIAASRFRVEETKTNV